MSIARHGLALTIVMVAAFAAGTARGQDINEGRNPPQLFAAACAACHQSPRGLGRQVGAASLANFLRQHYTTSREQAAMLAGYVASFANERPAGTQPPSAARRQQAPHDGEDQGLPGRRRPAAEEGRAGQPASPAARRRAPGEDGRLEEQTTAPAPTAPTGSRHPRASEVRPGRARPPAEAAAPRRPPASPAPPASETGEPQSANGPTAAIPGPEQSPSTARTDDIAD